MEKINLAEELFNRLDDADQKYILRMIDELRHRELSIDPNAEDAVLDNPIAGMRSFTESDQRNGVFGVACMSDKAQSGYQKAHKDGLTVYEYKASNTVRRNWIRYAYTIGDRWEEGLSESEMETILEHFDEESGST